MFCRVPGRFPVGRVCSALSQIVFRPAECVPGLFPTNRVFSAKSWVNFWSVECVPLRLGSIFGQQSVFCHVPGYVLPQPGSIFWSAEYVPPCPGLISCQESMLCHIPGRFTVVRVCSATSGIDFPLFSQNVLRTNWTNERNFLNLAKQLIEGF